LPPLFKDDFFIVFFLLTTVFRFLGGFEVGTEGLETAVVVVDSG
jgi:hypothetical protein